jgi:hypothetical protein
MTDTPRTQAELLTDFADQQNHGITAQKMRNFVVSTGNVDLDADVLFVQRDVAGNTQLSALYELDFPLTAPTATTCVNGKTYFSALDLSAWSGTETTRELFNPTDWVRSTSYASDWWSGTFPAYTVLELPPGRYRWFLKLIYAISGGGAPAGNSYVVAYLENVDDPSDSGGAEVANAGNIVAPVSFQASQTTPAVFSQKAEAVFSGDFMNLTNDGIRRVIPNFFLSAAVAMKFETFELQVMKVA